VAYGDAHEDALLGAIPWEEFEFTEYIFRMEDLIRERSRAFALAHVNPDEAPAIVEAADGEWRRCDRALEETALEFVVYRTRMRLKNAK
jgi:hypothetical protein